MADLHEGYALLRLLVEQGDALLEALLVGLPGLQQLGFPGAVCILDGSRHIHVLHHTATSDDLIFSASEVEMLVDAGTWKLVSALHSMSMKQQLQDSLGT